MLQLRLRFSLIVIKYGRLAVCGGCVVDVAIASRRADIEVRHNKYIPHDMTFYQTTMQRNATGMEMQAWQARERVKMIQPSGKYEV